MILTKLVLATHNKGKVAELSHMLLPLGIEVVSSGALGLSEPMETETTFEGNALIKARSACRESGLPALADDSGLCVRALHGDPGVYSADWAGPQKDFTLAMQKVEEALAGHVDRYAYFISVLAFVMPEGEEHLFEGRCEGELIWPPRGAGGFGYDPMFVPVGETRSFGEMGMDEKKEYSHRADALKKFLDFLS
ncbi:MAG: RdgB/HAM1 family non-canonical purine NTP pyrophosphatase [Pseudobdellovibrionaceae bacterium]